LNIHQQNIAFAKPKNTVFKWHENRPGRGTLTCL
jgi:hypothetical protein